MHQSPPAQSLIVGYFGLLSSFFFLPHLMQCHEFVQDYCTVIMSRYIHAATWTSHLISTFEKVGEGVGYTEQTQEIGPFGHTDMYLFFFSCFSFVRMHGASTYVRVIPCPMSHAFPCPIFTPCNEDLLGTYPSGSAKDNTSKRGEGSVGFWQGKRAVVGPVSGHDP